jgi:hypothetical protein
MAEEKLELGEILARLEKVERQNRILKLAGSLLVLLASMGFVMGQGKPNRTIEADEFVLKDAMRWKWNWGAREAAEWSVGMQLRKLLSVLALIVLVGTSWATGFSQCTVPLAGAVVKTDNYSALAADSGKLIAMNCAAPCNLLLPGTVQAPNYLLWVSNIGSARVTVTAGARKINGYGSTTIDVPHGQMVLVTTDGTEYLASDLIKAMDNAGYDVTNFGVRALHVPSGLPQMTCTATAGSKTLTCTSTTNFRVGDGVNVINAGATNTMTTPLAPTVTPTVSTAGTFTGLVRNGATGATSYNYCIAGWDAGGGHTACSPVTSISNGQATLGQQNATIGTIQLALDEVSVVTSGGNHGFQVGCGAAPPCGEVYIHGTQHESQFHGRYEVDSASDATHFTFRSQHDARVGASTAVFNGGTATWYNQNHIKAQSPLTGNNIYVVYGRSGATLNYLGVMLPQVASLTQATDVTYLTFDDYGPTYGTPPNRPPYITDVAPVTATNDNLITKIVDISGTTVTLRDAAVNSVSGGTVLFDNTADFNDAVAVSGSLSSVYFPITVANYSYVFRSRVTIPVNTRIIQSGTITFYDEVFAYGGVTWTGSLTTHSCNTGGTPQFGTECEPNVNFNGPIGLNVGGGGTLNMSHLNLGGGNPSQNVVMLFDDNGGWETFKNVQCNTGFGGADYSSRCIVARGSSDGAFGDFGGDFDNFLVNDMNPSQYNTDETPAIYFSYSLSGSHFTRLHIQRRGMLFRIPSTGGSLLLDDVYTQGNMNPMVVYDNDLNATIHTLLRMTHVVFDTTGHAGIVNLRGPQTDVIDATVANTTWPGSTGEGNNAGGSWINGPNIFVNGIGYKNGVGSIGSISTNDGVFATNGAALGYPQQSFNTSMKIGSAYPFFTQDSPGDAPTCVVAPGGPPYTAANAGWNLIYAPIYPNGGTGAGSKTGTACASTNGSSQQATVSIPAQIPGAVGMMWFNASNSAQVGCIGGNTLTTTLTSCVINTYYGPPASAPSSGPSGMRGPMAWTNQFYLGQFMKVSPTAFSALGTPANGTFLYCNDCTVANPCAGGGTGAFAKRLNGVWVCN